MPYSREARYIHHRQRSPKEFQPNNFRTVDIETAIDWELYKGEKFNQVGNKAVIGTLLKDGQWKVQSILELKR